MNSPFGTRRLQARRPVSPRLPAWNALRQLGLTSTLLVLTLIFLRHYAQEILATAKASPTLFLHVALRLVCILAVYVGLVGLVWGGVDWFVRRSAEEEAFRMMTRADRERVTRDEKGDPRIRRELYNRQS